MRLFVDVDDTLVLYQRPGPNPYGVYAGTPWEPNIRLIEGVKQFAKDNPEALIVVWSGGGRAYAIEWADRLGLGDIADGLLKDSSTMHLITEEDIVIDDMDLGGRRTHNPYEWPEAPWSNEERQAISKQDGS